MEGVLYLGVLVAQMVKESAWNAGNSGSIPGSIRLPGEGMASHL